MKKIKAIALTVVLGLSLVACKKESALNKVNADNVAAAAKRDAKSNKFPVLTFEKEEHDFGTIKQGEVVETTFKFKNTGDGPLVISNIKGSCGCTVPNDWPKDKIMPGEEGEFNVKFNSAGKKNQVSQTVTVSCNAKDWKKVVKIKVNVEVPEKE